MDELCNSGRRAALRTLLAIAACGTAGVQAQAVDFPNHVLRLVVPGPPSGATDFLSRVLANKLYEVLHQSVVVDNRPGAAGLLGARFVKDARPDGYTVLMGIPATHAIGPYMHSPAPYDPIKDFTPISLVATSPSLLVVSADSPFQTFAQLLAEARRRPGELSFGTPGVGQSQHIIGLRLAREAHIKLLHVPYVGTNPSITDLLGGRVSMIVAPAAAMVPLLKAGKVRILASSAPKRSVLLPQVPTFDELGLPNVGLESFFAFFGPPGMDPAIQGILSRAVVKALEDPQVKAQVMKSFAQPAAGTPAELLRFQQEQVSMYRAIIDEAGITADK